ncbi:hypothetical protein GCM10009819_29570 [Agromyces tropicus]|uniref:Uncharacterized protein n=1 Tax=Agromyces tropicus TaxID=555371 RepID=A0ABN2USQ1_9MICO
MEIAAQLAHLDAALLGTIETEFPEPYSEHEKAQIHAYLVLAHAVLEEHLEAIFERHFDRVAAWLDAPMVPLECVRLVVAVTERIPESKRVAYKRRDVRQMVLLPGRAEMVRQLGQNHGLKASNVEALAGAIGTDWQALENALAPELADLSTLGSKRGVAGHLSPYTEKSTMIAPSDGPDDVRKWVENGMRALLALESFLRGALRTGEPTSLISDWDGN